MARLSSRRLTWAIGGGVAAVVVCLVLALVVVAPMVKSPQQAAADAAPPAATPITTKAEKKPLSAKIVLRDAVVAGASRNVMPSDALASAAAVVTALPASGAATLQPGTVLAEANGEPLIAMDWPFPAYRDIHADDHGSDVIQLQKTLASLGYSTSDSGSFDALTQSGVKALYSDLGYVALTENASAETSTTSGSSATGDIKKTDASAGARQAEAAAPKKNVFVPARDVVAIPKVGAKITAIPLKVGQKITADTVLVKLDGQSNTVVASTTTDRALRIKPGAIGLLTTAEGEQFPVSVTAVAKALTDVAGLGQGIRIDAAFEGKVAPVTTSGSTVRLEITTANVAEGLVLPITAIYSTPDGNSYVIPAGAPDSRISVTVGANVDGWVEIKPGSERKENASVIVGWK